MLRSPKVFSADQVRLLFAGMSLLLMVETFLLDKSHVHCLHNIILRIIPKLQTKKVDMIILLNIHDCASSPFPIPLFSLMPSVTPEPSLSGLIHVN